MAENAKTEEVKKNLVRPVDLPIYDAPKVCRKKAEVAEEPCACTQAVKTVRLAVQDFFGIMKESKESVDHILDTGAAHTESKTGLIVKCFH